MYTENQDERYSIAEEAIFDAFLLLAREKEIEKITVSDIIKWAGVVRSTFYNHYENIPDLVSKAEDKALQDIFVIMENFHPENNTEICKRYFLTVCNYAKNNPFLTRLLGSPRGGAFFEKGIKMLHNYVTRIANSEQRCDEEFSYIVAAAIGCSIGILHKWTREKCKVPVEDIADLLTRTFTSGMLPYML